ncbi:MAG: DNA repair protein [Bacilli bacterium]|nr:DNA repair protein [Bacilli bacterium]
MKKTYLCIDLKTFYASVECVERGLDPFQTDLIVADPKRSRGAITLAITPHMKEQGIKNRCRVYEIPKNIHPIVAIPRMKKYMEYSAKIYKIYLKYISKEDIHVYSIDEAFLDVTSYLKLYKKDGIELAKMIMEDIYKTTKITATAGIGTNLFLAKVALDILSKHSKTNIGYLDEKLFKEKLWDYTPITDFWQIGKGIEERLLKYKIHTMKEITEINPNLLYKEFGINAKYLIDHANGIEPCTIKEIKEYKPKSNSLTSTQILYEDYNSKDAKIVLTEMIDNLLGKLILKEYQTKNITVYIGYSKDKIPALKYSISFEKPTSSYRKLGQSILEKYDYKINKDTPIRRIGISFNQLEKKNHYQLDIFQEEKEEQEELKTEKIINELKERFGKNSILRAISHTKKATAIKRNQLIGGHNAE